MDTAQVLVLILGIILIAFVLWFFFGKKKSVAASRDSAGVQEITVTVKGGYSPDVISAKAKQTLRIKFKREETSSCSERVVFPDFGISRELPAFKTTVIELTPETTGNFSFTCGMNMMRGKLIVEA